MTLVALENGSGEVRDNNGCGDTDGFEPLFWPTVWFAPTRATLTADTEFLAYQTGPKHHSRMESLSGPGPQSEIPRPAGGVSGFLPVRCDRVRLLAYIGYVWQ